MRKLSLVALLVSAILGGCASTPSYGDSQFATAAEREAYDMGSAHAGLAYCRASLDADSLGLHATASRLAATALTGARPAQLRRAYEAGVREGGGFSSPHRVPCSEATYVLNCSLSDYLGQWRDAQSPTR